MLLASLLSPASNGSKMPKQKEECSMQGKGPKGQNFGCVPPFTHGVLNRAVRLMMPAVIREPYDVQPNPPS